MNNIYQTALDIQDASNMSGVVLAFAEAMKQINAEMQLNKEGEVYRRNHPVVIMFFFYFNDMAGFSDAMSLQTYSNAYSICKKEAAKV